MSYRLDKPYTEQAKLNFIVQYNHQEGLQIVETEIAIFALENNEIMVDGTPQIDPAYEEKVKEQEENRINQLTMTSLDLITYVNKAGVDYVTIQAFLQANPMLNMQLTYSQNCYCGVVRQLCPLQIGDITLTDEMVVYAFRKKNGEDVKLPKPQLTTTEPTVEPDVEEPETVETEIIE